MDRTAHRRVGAAAIVAFVALLLIGASHGPAQASPATSAATPDSGSQSAPSEPYRQTDPSDPVPGFGHDRDGDGFDHHGPDGDGGGEAPPSSPPVTPAPNSGTNTT
jgi:hypothetical protein